MPAGQDFGSSQLAGMAWPVDVTLLATILRVVLVVVGAGVWVVLVVLVAGACVVVVLTACCETVVVTTGRAVETTVVVLAAGGSVAGEPADVTGATVLSLSCRVTVVGATAASRVNTSACPAVAVLSGAATAVVVEAAVIDAAVAADEAVTMCFLFTMIRDAGPPDTSGGCGERTAL